MTDEEVAAMITEIAYRISIDPELKELLFKLHSDWIAGGCTGEVPMITLTRLLEKRR